MAPSVIVALCLLAVASAVPVSWNIECATTCGPSTTTKFNYVIGKTYTYSYNGKSSLKLAGKGSSNDEWSTEVQVTRVSLCNLAISVKGAVANTQAEKYPLIVAVNNNDRFEKVCHHPNDDHESVNLKRGIAAALQNVLTSFYEESESITETDVFGKCPTTYTVETIGDTHVVTKEKNHNQCEVHFLGIPVTPHQFSWTAFPLRESKSTCQQVIRKGIFRSISCTDKKTVLAAYGAVDTIQESKLQFVSESSDHSAVNSIHGITLVSKSMKHEFKTPQKNSALVGKLNYTLSNICSMIQGQGNNGVAPLLTEVIKILKYVPEETIVDSLNNIRSGKFCSDYVRLEALYLDAIAFVGESGALKVMAQEVAAGRVTGGREALYTAALHLFWAPKIHHIAAIVPIFAMENPTSPLLLAAACVVNNYCEGNSACTNEAPVREILAILANKLDTQCTPAFSKEKPVVVLATLKALGNIGYMSTETAKKLVKCVKTEGVEINVRFAATMTAKAAPCKQEIKGALLPVYFDQSVNTEVRIGSYLASVKCSTEADFQNIVKKIKTDANIQVHSFVLSHMSNLRETKWPLKQKLRSLSKKVEIPQTCKSNLFKYSRNIAMSYDSTMFGFGAEVDANIVYTPESYIARILNMELNINPPLSHISGIHNIAEVGARVESLDPIFEKAFGPASYLHNTPLKAIIKDTYLFVRQNGAKLFNKLEDLLKQKEKPNLDSMVKSILDFFEGKIIKLPKADLYFKLMGQEWAFLTTAGPMQEINIDKVVKTISAVVADAIVGVKDLNLDTARAVQLQFLYGFPTIQGIPLINNFELSAVTTMAVKTNMKSNALIKIIPSINIAIEGVIGYGNKINTGIKMKHDIYTTNGLSIHGVMDNNEIELKIELPEKMELFHINSEVYFMKTDANLYESRVQPDLLDATYIQKKECSNIIESVTGLNICYNVNVPHVTSPNSFPLGQPTTIEIHLQKSDSTMKGYRLAAKLKNKPNEKYLKIVAGTYGSASSSETSINMALSKSADKYLTTLNVQSANMDSAVEVTFANHIDYAALQVTLIHKYGASSPLVATLKFDVKKEAVANGNEYKLSGLAGLSHSLSNNHRFFSAKFSHVSKGQVIHVDITATSEMKLLPLTIEFGADLPVNTLWLLRVRTVGVKIGSEQAGATFYFKYLMESNKIYKTISEINVPSLMKPVKITGTVVPVEFLNFETLVSVEMGNAAVLRVEGPWSITVSQGRIKNQYDMTVSGAFKGAYKITHAFILSHKNIQQKLYVSYGATPIIFIDVYVDHSHRKKKQEISLKFVANIPVLAEAEFATVISSGLIHSTMNVQILPTTSVARRLKGYADFNYAENKINGDLFLNAGKDNTKKLSFVVGYSLNSATGAIMIQGNADLAGLPYGFKVEAVSGSPLKFFLGTNGVNLALTLPSNKIVVVKSIFNVDYSESLLILKPLVVLHTVNEHNYEISGSVTLKKLPKFLNFDISNEWTISAPEIKKKVTFVSKLTHDDTDARCLIVFKSGFAEITLGKPMELEITYDASTGKYSWLVSIKAGSSITKVAINVAVESGFNAFTVNVDAALPLTTVEFLGLKVVKTADGTLTAVVTKNQQIMAKFSKLQYIASSVTKHTISLEFPSRTIELRSIFTGNGIIIKAFSEHNMSSRMKEIEIKITKKSGAGLFECFVNTPSLSKEMRIAIEVSPAKLGSVLNVDIQFPVLELKTFLKATVKEINIILKDLVNDGLLPELSNLIELVVMIFAELSKFYETVKVELSKIISKYYKTIEKEIKKFWRNYEGDIISLWNTLNPATYEKIITRYPEEHAAVVNFYYEAIIPTVNEVISVIMKFFHMPMYGVAEIMKILRNDVPSEFHNVVIRFKSTTLYHILREKVSNFIAYPTTRLVYGRCSKAFKKFRMIYVEDLKIIYENLMMIPSIRKMAEYLIKVFHGKKVNMNMILETLTNAADVVVTELWGITYKISGDRLIAVVPLPVSALTRLWEMMTTHVTGFVHGIIATVIGVLDTIRIGIPEVVRAIAKRVPGIIKYLNTELPEMVDEVVPDILSFVEFVMVSSPVKLIQANINELIAMYPADCKAFENLVYLCVITSVDYAAFVVERFMEIPVVTEIMNRSFKIFPSNDITPMLLWFSQWATMHPHNLALILLNEQ